MVGILFTYLFSFDLYGFGFEFMSSSSLLLRGTIYNHFSIIHHNQRLSFIWIDCFFVYVFRLAENYSWCYPFMCYFIVIFFTIKLLYNVLRRAIGWKDGKGWGPAAGLCSHRWSPQRLHDFSLSSDFIPPTTLRIHQRTPHIRWWI